MDVKVFEKKWRVAKIPKRNKKFRMLYIPDSNTAAISKACIPRLRKILDDIRTADVSYAFESHRNCALNAAAHIGYAFTLSVDLEDFFDSITETSVKSVIPDDIRKICFTDGAPRQGFPSSPIISNIAMAKVDEKIIGLLARLERNARYTRYADDLTFSFDTPGLELAIVCALHPLLDQHGFKINTSKTCLQSAKNGRRIITGIGVSDDGIHPTRETRRRIRAALHQQNEVSAKGLQEWAKCKFPKAHTLPDTYSQVTISEPTFSYMPSNTAEPGYESAHFRHIELCLFDLDNTLVRTEDLAGVRESFKHDNVDQRATLFKLLHSDYGRLIYKEAQLLALRDKFPDLKIGVFTRAPRAYAQQVLYWAYPNVHWDVIIGYEDVTRYKPSGQGILIAMSKLGITNPLRVAMIGDAADDIRAAYDAGCLAALEQEAWAKPRTPDNWKAVSLHPDRGVHPSTLPHFLQDPWYGLATLEKRYAPSSEITSFALPEILFTNHFMPSELGGDKTPHRVYALGRYFKAGSGRHNSSPFTQAILKYKDACKVPTEWIEELSSAISSSTIVTPALKHLPLHITVIPSRPGRPARMEGLLSQLSQRLTGPTYGSALIYHEGVKSNHGDLLSATERFANVRDHLQVCDKESIKGRHVVVIDDVVTSGASLIVAKQKLLEAGATHVTCLALAQTVGDRSNEPPRAPSSKLGKYYNPFSRQRA